MQVDGIGSCSLGGGGLPGRDGVQVTQHTVIIVRSRTDGADGRTGSECYI